MRRVLIVLVCVTCGYCGSQSPTGPTPGPSPTSPPPSQPPSGPQIFVGAGDIAMCDVNSVATAALLDSIGGYVFTLGDNAYFRGTREEYRNCYDNTWGKHKGRTFPVPGNHEYMSAGAAPYFEYFGERAGPQGKGYYSFDLGKWHLISLNSEIVAGVRRDFAQSRAQEEWLRKDLADHGKPCTLAYWHRPLFSSGTHGATPEADRLWMILYQNGVDLVVNGHDHHYERFLPQTPAGVKDSVRGIEQIIAGTGGGDLRGVRRQLMPNSAMQIFGHFGVLKLTLGDGEYRHAFLDIDGRVWDQGGRRCH